MRTQLIILAFCALVRPAISQSPWTLQECINYAVAHNIPLRQANLANEISRNNSNQSKAALLPTLNAGASHVYNVGKTVDRFTNTFANSQVLSQNFYLSGSVVLWSGFSQYNASRAAELSYLSGVEQSKQQQNDLSLSIASAYINVIFTEEILKVSKNQQQITREQLDRTGKLVAAGALAKSAEYEIAAQLANEDVNVTTAENNATLALLSLRQLMNLDSVSNFSVARPVLEVQENQLLEGTIEQTYELGLKNQPGIKSGEYAILSAEKSLAASRGRVSPTLVFSGSLGTGTSELAKDIVGVNYTGFQAAGITSKGDSVYAPKTELVTRNTPFADQFKNNVSKSFGFTLNIPLFNGLQTHTAIKNAKLAAFNAKLSQDLQKQTLYKNVTQAYADARAGLNRYNANRLSVQAAGEAFRYAQEKFNAGAISAFDFSSAKNCSRLNTITSSG
jgi:outer membrane protein